MGTTQPAISFRIRQLEKELGVTLFCRGAGKTHLTSVGKKLIQDVNEITRLSHQIVRLAAEERLAVDARVLHPGEAAASTSNAITGRSDR
jgi:DNA-binding transcriptional LysR family regulator